MRLEQLFSSLRPAVQQIKIFENRYCINIIGYDPNIGKYLGLEIARSGNHTSDGAVKAALSSSKAGAMKYGGEKEGRSACESAGSCEGGLDIKFLPTAFDSEVQVREYISNRGLMLLHENVYCIYGVIRLTESYYLIAVTHAEVVASIHGNHIYKISETVQIPVTYRVRNTTEESRYKSILQLTDFSSSFYFSYTYDLTNSLQRITERDLRYKAGAHPPQKRFAEVQEMFMWNFFALEPFLALGAGGARGHDDKDSLRWVVPVIHGFVRQSCIELCDDHCVRYSLIARRSRHFAGTRYLRRGVDSEGYVANEVETEQILTREVGALGLQRSTSLVQVRGSIPLFWSHTNLLSPQPGIVIEDGCGKNSAWRHFSRLRARYGEQINVLNLVRQSESAREVLVGRAFTDLCHEYMLSHGEGASSAPLRYVSYDFLAHKQGSGGEGLFGDLVKIGESFYPLSGYFVQPALGAIEGYARFPATADGVDAATGGRLCLSEDQERVLLEVTLLKGDSGDAADAKLHLVDDDSIDESDEVYLSQRNVSEDSGDGNAEQAVVAEGEGEGEASISFSADLLAHITFETFFDTRLEGELAEGFESGAVEPHDMDLGATESSFQLSKRRIDALISRHASESYELGYGAPVGLLQTGVLRTNCIDCLDRTNIAQFCYAKTVLLKQLKALGLSLSRESMAGLLALCLEAWAAHGDELARQYAGSGAMHRLDEKVGDNKQKEYVLNAGASNALVAIQRYFSNVSFDAERQQAMDLLLGVHRPQFGQASIWDEDSRPVAVRRRSAELARSYRERSAALAAAPCAGKASADVAVAIAVAVTTGDFDSAFTEGDAVSLDVDVDVYCLSLPLLERRTRARLSSFHDDDFLLTNSLTDLAQAARGRHNTVALNRARYTPYPKRSLFTKAAGSNDEVTEHSSVLRADGEEGRFELLKSFGADGGEELVYHKYLNIGALLDCAYADYLDTRRFYEQSLMHGLCEDTSKTTLLAQQINTVDDAVSVKESEVGQEEEGREVDSTLGLDAINREWLAREDAASSISCFPSFGRRSGPRRASSVDDETAPEDGREVTSAGDLRFNLDPTRMIMDSTNQFVEDSISTLKWLTLAPFTSSTHAFDK